MEQSRSYKLCLIGDSLAGGGAEKVQAILSQFFVNCGVSISHVIVTDDVEYNYSGELINLGKQKDQANGFFNKLKRFRLLNSYLSSERFDFIIDSRVKNKPIQEWFTAKFLYKSPTIFMIHSAEEKYYFPASKWLARLIHNKAYAVVTVTEAMKNFVENKYQLQNVVAIHNPINFDDITYINDDDLGDFVLTVGRMNDDIKQLDKLIVAYSKSILPSKAIKLIIVGDGKLMTSLKQLAFSLQLDKLVVFAGRQSPYIYMKSCRFLILSSRSEGFANVLIETLACNRPVVSFDCDYGPREIIKHAHNGLLVENQNFEALTFALNEFVTNKSLYQFCKQNAKSSVAQFSVEIIGKQWLELMKINVS